MKFFMLTKNVRTSASFISMMIGSEQKRQQSNYCFLPGGSKISYFVQPRISSCTRSDLKRTKASLISAQQVDFFYLQ